MAESIVKVPSQEAQEMDFLAFSFNGKHSWDDFHIYRTSDGDRYNENLVPTMQDKTAEVPGGDGMYYFGTTHKQREFNINIAFDNMSEVKYREMRQWLNGKEMGDLWFSEAPYKVYTVKPTGTPNLKTLCFDNTRYIIIDKDKPPIGFKWEVKTETKETEFYYTTTYTHTIEYPSKYTYNKVLPDGKAQANISITNNLLTIKEVYTYQTTLPQPPSNIQVEFKIVERVYKGEGTIQFTAYYPYAHTPDYVGRKMPNQILSNGNFADVVRTSLGSLVFTPPSASGKESMIEWLPTLTKFVFNWYSETSSVTGAIRVGKIRVIAGKPGTTTIYKTFQQINVVGENKLIDNIRYGAANGSCVSGEDASGSYLVWTKDTGDGYISFEQEGNGLYNNLNGETTVTYTVTLAKDGNNTCLNSWFRLRGANGSGDVLVLFSTDDEGNVYLGRNEVKIGTLTTEFKEFSFTLDFTTGEVTAYAEDKITGWKYVNGTSEIQDDGSIKFTKTTFYVNNGIQKSGMFSKFNIGDTFIALGMFKSAHNQFYLGQVGVKATVSNVNEWTLASSLWKVTDVTSANMENFIIGCIFMNHYIQVKWVTLVNLSELYGLGNEPTSAEQFLLDYPEFKEYVQPGNRKNGKVASSYNSFVNKGQWLDTSSIQESDSSGANWGDIPTHFILRAPQDMSEYNQKEALKFKVGALEITVRHKSSEKNKDGAITYTHYESIEWDSKTGMVTAMVLPTSDAAEKKRMPIPYTGNSLGAIPAQQTVSWGIAGDDDTTYSNSNLTLDYHYWYY